MRQLYRWLAYRLGYLRFLWLAQTGQIVFREDELEALAERLGRSKQ